MVETFMPNHGASSYQVPYSITQPDFINMELRNKSNIFSVDQGIDTKRTENCINARII